MTILETLNKIQLTGIIPVVTIEKLSDALPLAKALCAGGIAAAEITFRTDCAADAIAQITREIPNMLIGAGTVVNAKQAEAAISAGAKFVVSPGIDGDIVRKCIDRGVAVIPGCVSASDIMKAVSLGLDTVKFFPAEAMGGVKTLKALSAPFAGVKFLPTGGIDENNLRSYLDCDCVIACASSKIAEQSLIAAGDFEQITARTRSALLKMFNFGIKHIGVNADDGETASRNAMIMSTMFGFTAVDKGGAIFAGDLFEFMKYKFHGTYGHLGIATDDMERAVAYFKGMGFTFLEDGFTFDENGKQNGAAYFTGEYFGYAIHLIRR